MTYENVKFEDSLQYVIQLTCVRRRLQKVGPATSAALVELRGFRLKNTEKSLKNGHFGQLAQTRGLSWIQLLAATGRLYP
jgi:hypothetical protein